MSVHGYPHTYTERGEGKRESESKDPSSEHFQFYKSKATPIFPVLFILFGLGRPELSLKGLVLSMVLGMMVKELMSRVPF